VSPFAVHALLCPNGFAKPQAARKGASVQWEMENGKWAIGTVGSVEHVIFRVALLIFGVFACSTAVIMIKAKPPSLHPVHLAAFRLLIAAVALTPFMLRDLRRYREHFDLGEFRTALLPGLMLAAHYVSWIIAVNMTRAVNASLIVNMVPVVMPFFLFFLIRERLTAGEMIATGVALAGVSLLGWTDFDTRPEFLAGDALCFASMLLFAFYLALGRRNRRIVSIWLYVVPLYYTAGLLCLIVGVGLGNPFRAYTLREGLVIFGLALVPTVMGHSILNVSMKHFRGQVVSILNLGQFVFAGTMAYFIYGEVPSWALYVAAAALLGGAIVVLRAHPEGT
jgi:drug/metabolite transporter (DMT)-like permease